MTEIREPKNSEPVMTITNSERDQLRKALHTVRGSSSELDLTEAQTILEETIHSIVRNAVEQENAACAKLVAKAAENCWKNDKSLAPQSILSALEKTIRYRISPYESGEDAQA